MHIRMEDGVAVSHRIPVFRTSWERNRVPRGVPLRIDPLRGTSTLGYIVGGVSYGGLAGIVPGYGSAAAGSGALLTAAGSGAGT